MSSSGEIHMSAITDAVGDPWDFVEEPKSFYPFVRIPMESGITCVVGANESGKSQLLTAIKCLLTGEGIERRDFCLRTPT